VFWVFVVAAGFGFVCCYCCCVVIVGVAVALLHLQNLRPERPLLWQTAAGKAAAYKIELANLSQHRKSAT